MKIVNRKTFLELPENTVYAKMYGCDGFNELQIKGESYINDWWYEDLNDPDWDSSEKRYEALEKARKTGENFPLIIDSCSRDGLFEEEQEFAVYDDKDILVIINRLQRTLNSQQ